MSLKEGLSYFQLELLKNQLEQSLEATGSTSKESIKLILHYSSMLAQLSKQQTESDNHELAQQLLVEGKQIQLKLAFQILLPGEPPKALTQQFQYWRLLFNITVELYLVLMKLNREQEGLSFMLKVYNQAKDKVFKGAIEQYCESDLLCFHIAYAWDKLNNKRQAEFMAQEAILMIQQTLVILEKVPNKTTAQINLIDKKIKMSISLNDLLSKYYENNIQQKLFYLEKCLEFSNKSYGKEHSTSLRYLRKLNSIKAEIEFQVTLEKINAQDFVYSKKDSPREIEFDIKDEVQDKNILSYLNRPITAKQQTGSQSRIRKLKPSTQTEQRLSQIIRKLNVTTTRSNSAARTNIIIPNQDYQIPKKNFDNIYYMFSNNRQKTADTNSQIQQTTNYSIQRRINIDQSQPVIVNNYTSTSSVNQALTIQRIKTQDSKQVPIQKNNNNSLNVSIFTNLNFQNQEMEYKLIQKSFINDMIIQRPVFSKDMDKGQNKRFQLIRSKTRSPQELLPQEESNKKLQRIKEFDNKRKNIMINCQKIKKINKDLVINNNNGFKNPQEQQKISKSSSYVTFDRKSEKLIIIPFSDKKEAQVTQIIEMDTAVMRIQRFYRQRRDALILIHKNKAKEYQRQSINPGQSNQRSSYTIISSDSDSLKDILEQDEAEEHSPKRGQFKRSNTMLKDEDQKFLIRTDTMQHQILHQKIPQIQINSDKFKRSQNGRNSVRLVIQSAKNQNYLQPPSQKQLASYILLPSQRSRIREESDESFQQFHQPLYIGSLKNIDANGLNTQYFAFMSFYMLFQNQGNSLWKIHGIETSVLFGPVQSEISDTSRTHRPMYIQLVILFETHFFKGPIVWKISYDKKLFKSRKQSTIFKFADSILQQYLNENMLNIYFQEVIEERKARQTFVIQIILQQQHDDSIQNFMEKIYFLLARYSFQQFQMNGQNLKICGSCLEVPKLKRQIDRWQQMQLRYRELRANQRASNIQLPYIILTRQQVDVLNQFISLTQVKQNEIQFQSIISEKASGKFKKVKNTILFAVRAGGLKSQSKQSSPTKLEVSIPLLNLSHQINTTPDIGAITLNKQMVSFESDTIQLSSVRDIYGQQVKKILHQGPVSKRMSINLDSVITNLTQNKTNQKIDVQQSKKEVKIMTSSQNNIEANKSSQSEKALEKQHLFKSVQINKKYKRQSEIPFRASLTATESTQKFNQSEKTSQKLISQLSENKIENQRSMSDINSLQKIDSVNKSQSPIKQQSQDRPRLFQHQFTINEEDSARNKPEQSKRNSILSKLVSLKRVSILQDFDQIIQHDDYIIFKQDYFDVSPFWKSDRRKVVHKVNDKYFEQQLQTRQKNNYCYLNPFPNKSLILCVLLKKDGTLFQVQVTLLCLKEIELLTTQISQSKDIKVRINFIQFDRKHGNRLNTDRQNTYWEDEVIIYFKDFVKWFLEDFKLYEFISKQGFTQKQRISIIKNINQNISIQDCKLRIEYYQDKGQKKAKRKYERKDLHMEQIMYLERYFEREVGQIMFQTSIDQFINNDEKFLISYYKILQEQRIKVAQTLRRKENRVKTRTLKQKALNSAVEFIGHQREIGPMICIGQNDSFIHQVKRDEGIGIPHLSYELAKDLLQGYNTLRILKGEKYVFPYKNNYGHYSYLIWSSVQPTKTTQDKIKVRIIHPFSKYSSDLFELTEKNKNKLINLSQIEGQYKDKSSVYQITSLKNLMFKVNLKRILTLSGYQTVLQYQQKNYQYFTKIDQIILQHMINFHSCSTDDLYQLQLLLKVSLLATTKNDGSIWNIYFQQTKRLLYGKLTNFGPCFLEMTVYVDTFHFSLKQGLHRQMFVKVNVFKKENMRSLVSKIILGKQDLVMLFNKLQLSFEIDTQLPAEFFDNLYGVICKLFVFEKEGLYMAPKIHLKSHRSINMELSCKFPWIENYQYKDISFQPYQAQNNFYNQTNQNPQVVCHISTFIELPAGIQPISGQFSDSKIVPQIIFNEQSPILIACIFTITFSKSLKSYFIHMYFQKTQRKFVTQISLQEVRVRRFNHKLDEWVRDRCGLQNRQQLFDLLSSGKGKINVQLWIALSRTFHIFINDHNKTLLYIPIFQITCVFQEVLYHKVRTLAKENEEALFQIHIEQSKHKIPGQLPGLNKPLRSIRIIESNHFNVFIKIQWLSHHEKMQSCKIPLTQILMGYYKKYGSIFGQKQQNNNQITQESVYNYVFVHADLIKMAQIVTEMIILNWQNTKTDLFDILPLDNFPKQKQSVKTNASLSLSMVFAYKEYILMYSGLLIRKPSTMMTLFLRRNKDHVCFYIQRMNDCQTCKKIVEFEEIEGNYPGFRAQIQGSNYELGRKLFLLFKNRMILHSYYKLKD